MRLYGYKSSHSQSLKIRRGGLCYCCWCWAEELSERKERKRNCKRARRWGKIEIKNQLKEI
jgi:hypothetical protein